MRRVDRFAIVSLLAWALGLAGCTQPGSAARTDRPALADTAKARLAQTSGTLSVPGLTDEVRVIRDHWGVPHIYAKNTEDLFFAQGFVQAQDRLFQMDLWRRSTQGQLAEILGPEYLERDRLSRVLRYRGDMEAEWSSYAPDAKQIIGQFVKGINAWVEIARKNPPVEFTLTGYEPGLWQPEDILSRAEAFTMVGNVTNEVFRARVTAAVGPEKAATLLPPDPVIPVAVPHGTDLQLIDTKLSEVLSQIGTGASGRGADLVKLRAANVDHSQDGVEAGSNTGSNNWVVSGAKSMTGHPLLANDPHRALDHPSLRYVVHLNAPGWNVIGSVQPWLPGVSFGHNDRVAWGCTVFRADVQDLYLEKLNPANPRQYEYQGKWVEIEIQKDRVRVKGRSEPVEVELQYTRHGPVVAVAPDKHIAYVLRWTGSEPGSAAYLGGLGIDRAQNWAEFRDGLKRWKIPGENFVYADVDGNIGYQAAALTPIRQNWPGLLPVPGWTGEYEWSGWHTLDALPHEANPKTNFIATANHNTLPPGEKRVIGYDWSDPARINRIREVLTSKEKFDIEDFERLQHDQVAWNAEQIAPLLSRVSAQDSEVERVRKLLVDWDRNVSKESAAAAAYVIWEQQLVRQLAAGKVPGPIGAEYRLGSVLVPVLTRPSTDWFGPKPASARDKLLLAALTSAVAELKERLGPDAGQWAWGRLHSATFRHPLAGDPETQKLFNIGPFARAGYGLTPFATGGRGFEQNSGSSYRQVIDVAAWDRSVATSAPGESGQPTSPHFDDLAKLWAEHKYFPLSFTQSAVQGNAEATLTLVPRRPTT